MFYAGSKESNIRSSTDDEDPRAPPEEAEGELTTGPLVDSDELLVQPQGAVTEVSSDNEPATEVLDTEQLPVPQRSSGEEPAAGVPTNTEQSPFPHRSSGEEPAPELLAGTEFDDSNSFRAT